MKLWMALIAAAGLAQVSGCIGSHGSAVVDAPIVVPAKAKTFALNESTFLSFGAALQGVQEACKSVRLDVPAGGATLAWFLRSALVNVDGDDVGAGLLHAILRDPEGVQHEWPENSNYGRADFTAPGAGRWTLEIEPSPLLVSQEAEIWYELGVKATERPPQPLFERVDSC